MGKPSAEICLGWAWQLCLLDCWTYASAYPELICLSFPAMISYLAYQAGALSCGVETELRNGFTSAEVGWLPVSFSDLLPRRRDFFPQKAEATCFASLSFGVCSCCKPASLRSSLAMSWPNIIKLPVFHNDSGFEQLIATQKTEEWQKEKMNILKDKNEKVYISWRHHYQNPLRSAQAPLIQQIFVWQIGWGSS